VRAAVMRAENEPLVIEELTGGSLLGARQVLVQVDATGVCHSDLTILSGAVPLPPPMVLGHEGAGTVLDVGGLVTRVKPGDRVIGTFAPVCGDCWFCLHGEGQYCRNAMSVMLEYPWQQPDGTPVMSMSGLGTFAEQMVCHEWSLVPVESTLPAEQLALIGCGVATGVGAALNTAAVEPGSSVAVIGCGGVGQFVIQGARIAGAAQIIAIDPVEFKRDTAVGFGATDVLDPTGLDVPREVRKLTGRRGADYVFEVLGRSQTMLDAFKATRKGGTCTIVGMASNDDTVTFAANDLYAQGKRLLGCYYGGSQVRRDFQRYVDLAETGRLDIGGVITQRLPLSEVNDAFTAMKSGTAIRTVLTP
jgi:S-(hydroxymethyl)glutathione dehydrogenase/alcohol dehydrogenase